MSAIRSDGADSLLLVFAKPRGSRSRMIRLLEDHLEVQLAAPPVDGAANEELRALLSRELDLPKSRISIDKGSASRHKQVRLCDASPGPTLEKLRALLDVQQDPSAIKGRRAP